MSHITWLHLSDFHFCNDKSPKGKVEDYNREVVLDSLLEDLRTYPQENNLEIDFIVVTGDIAYYGRKDEYALAANYFDQLLKIFNLPKNRLFIVPGNHDVDRDKINPYLKPTLDSRDLINGFLMDKEAKESYFKKFENYRDFVNQYFSGDLDFDYDTRYFWTKKFSLNETEIGLMGLNSSWNACGDEDRLNLLIGEKQVSDALKQVSEADLSIAVLHHPFDWLKDDDKKDVLIELEGKCDFILHGHLHEPGLSCATTPDRSLLVIPAGAAYEKRYYRNSYNILSINKDTNEATQHLRCYSDKRKEWIPDIETFRNAPDGIFGIDLTKTNPFINLAPEPAVPPELETPTVQLDPHYAHSKPLEKYWAGRKKELEQLSQWYQDEAVKVIGLIGFGGVGKSALARHWLEEIKPDGIFWWCFYHEPSLDAFLLAILDYLSGGQFDSEKVTSSAARVRTLLDYLTKGRFVLVLDGLEEMQNADDKGEHFGEMKEIAFTDLLRGIAERNHKSLTLITTRYPLKDIQPYEGQSFSRIFPEKLTPEDARELMRKRGVKGDDKALNKAAQDYNYYALGLKLIAAYLKEYFDGDINHVSEIPFSAIEADKKVELILSAYHEKLDNAQKTFMSIFSIFRLPVEQEALSIVFYKEIPGFDNSALVELNEFEFKQMLKHLLNLGLISEDKHGSYIAYSIHLLVRHYYYEHLKDKVRTSIHKQVAQYYEKKAHPKPQTLDDLTHAIEAFHHTVQTKDYDKAVELYKQKINIKDSAGNSLLTLCSGAYELDLSLISQLFPVGNTNQNPLVASVVKKAWLVNEVGFCLQNLGRIDEAILFFRRYIQMVLADNDWLNASAGSLNLCINQHLLGDLAEGEKTGQQALDWARQADDEFHEMCSLAYLGNVDSLLGKNKEANNFFQKANEAVRRIYSQTKWLFGISGSFYAEYLARNGERELAEEVTHESLAICQKHSAINDIARCYRLLGDLKLEKPDYSKTEEYLKEGIQIARNIGFQEEIAKLHLGFSRLYLTQNNLQKADRVLKEALSICARCGYKIIEIDARNVKAKLHKAANQPTLARQEAETVLSISEECGYYWGKIDAQEFLDQLD